MSDSIVFLSGRYLPKSEAWISPDDRGFLFGDGIYEVVRAYGGRFFELPAHVQRLRNGLAALQIAGADTVDFATVTATLLDRNGLETSDAIVYIQITRGAAPRIHRFPDPPVPPTVYAFAAPLQRRGDPTGVRVITVPDIRWTRCDIKSINLLGNCLAAQRAFEADAVEAIQVRDGVALECAACSLFGVFDGEVRTAPETNYILPSVTRGVTLRLCREARIPVRLAPILVDELPLAEELFLAGTTVGIMPVVEVDGRPVGSGTSGPLTRELQQLFARRTGLARERAPAPDAPAGRA